MDFYINEDTAWVRRIARWAVDVVVVISLAWFLVYGFCGQVRIDGNSMQPLLDARDVVLVNRLAYDVGSPKRFDVVVFQRGDQNNNVKRVIGLPGETVQIKDGKVLINGEAPAEDIYVSDIGYAGEAQEPVELGKDEFFVIGDNHSASDDSRLPGIANIKKKEIFAKAWFIVSPGEHFRFI